VQILRKIKDYSAKSKPILLGSYIESKKMKTINRNPRMKALERERLLNESGLDFLKSLSQEQLLVFKREKEEKRNGACI
jgi:hypothetical protein